MAPPPQSPAPMYVNQVSAQDVLLGRGTGPNDHIGNCTFRDEVEKRKEEYSRADNRLSKEIIIRRTIAQVKARHGRFLRKIARKEIVSCGLRDDDRYEVVTDISALAYKTRLAFRYSHRKKHDASAPVTSDGALRASISSSNWTPPQSQQSTPSIPDKKRKSSSMTTSSDSLSHVDSKPSTKSSSTPKTRPLLLPSCTTQEVSDIKTRPPANASIHTANAAPQSQQVTVVGHTQRLSQLLQQNRPLAQLSSLNHLSNPDSRRSSLSDYAFARLRFLIENPDVDRNRRLQDLGSVAADANRNFVLSNFFAQSRIQQELSALAAAGADATSHSNTSLLGSRLSASTSEADRHLEQEELRARTRRELELGKAEHGRGMNNERSRLEQEQALLEATSTITDNSRSRAERADQGPNSLQLDTLRARERLFELEVGLNPQDCNRNLVLGNNMARSRIEQELAILVAVANTGSNRNSNVDVNPLEALRARLQLGIPITPERDVSALQDHIARQRVEQLFPVRQTPDVDSYRYLGLNHFLSHSRADDGLLGNASNLPYLEQILAARTTRPPPQVTTQNSQSSTRSSDGSTYDDSNSSRTSRQRGQ